MTNTNIKSIKTVESFDYQWKHLPIDLWLQSNEFWRNNVCKFILDELKVVIQNYNGYLDGQRVLDAGCGNGRWSYGFERMGAEVYGFDSSPAAIEYARRNIKGHFEIASILDDIKTKLYQDMKFDLIWCWGVLHHTSQPFLALSNLARFLKDDGLMHIFVYGKRPNIYKMLRWLYNRFNYPNRVKISHLLSRINKRTPHGNFDQFSPAIASEHTYEEVRDWFDLLDMKCERVYPDWRKGLEKMCIFVNAWPSENKDKK